MNFFSKFLFSNFLSKGIKEKLLNSNSFHKFVVQAEIARKSQAPIHFFKEFKKEISKDLKNVFFSNQKRQ